MYEAGSVPGRSFRNRTGLNNPPSSVTPLSLSQEGLAAVVTKTRHPSYKRATILPDTLGEGPDAAGVSMPVWIT